VFIVEESSDIGRRLRQIRHARGKSLAVVAGLAGISESYLSRLEHGQRALDRRSLIVALANALEISPSELTKLPVPAPGNGGMDTAVDAVRRALLAVSYDIPGGQVQPVEALRARVTAMVATLCRAEDDREVGAALPGLIRDLHTSITVGRDVAQLLELGSWLHTQGTVSWLGLAGASLDLRSQAITLAQRAARERDAPVPLGLAAVAGAGVALAADAFDLARAALGAVSVPTSSPEMTQLAGHLTLRGSVVAAADGRNNDVASALDAATELAARTGEGNAYGLGFGPINVDLFRMRSLLEAGDYEQAASVAERIHPEGHDRVRQAYYWADYGRALARMRGRRADAVRALRRAETISPRLIQRGPVIRDVLAELLARSQRDAMGLELRGMAHRAGLPA
jgi:transcriptional regulator with XRE-family HTH domain